MCNEYNNFKSDKAYYNDKKKTARRDGVHGSHKYQVTKPKKKNLKMALKQVLTRLRNALRINVHGPTEIALNLFKCSKLPNNFTTVRKCVIFG